MLIVNKTEENEKKNTYSSEEDLASLLVIKNDVIASRLMSVLYGNSLECISVGRYSSLISCLIAAYLSSLALGLS